MSEDPALSLLLVEDEPAHAEAVRRSLSTSELMNIEVRSAASLSEYRLAVAARPPDIALLDLVLPDGKALEVLVSPPEASPFPIVVMTSFGNEQIAVAAMKAGAIDYLVKSPETFAQIPHIISRALGTWNGLMERRKSEEALRTSEARLAGIMEATADGILAVDSEGRVIKVNRRFGEMWRIPRELIDRGDGNALLASVLGQLADPEAFLRRVRELYHAFEEETAFIMFRDGRTFERFSSPLVRDGDITGRIWSFRDVTPRQRAENALRESEEKHRLLYETMIQGVVHRDDEGRVISVNPAAERILGLSLDQMYGRTPIDPRLRAIREDGTDYPGDAHPAMIALSTGREVQDEVMGILNPAKEAYTWINMQAVPQFRPGESRPYQVFTMFSDVTERKLSRDRLTETLVRLRQAVTSTIRVLGLTVEARDPYTAGHQQRATKLAAAIAEELGLPSDRIEGLRLAGEIHDIGKISLPSEILSKPTRLTPFEFDLIKTHPKKGYDILKGVEFPWPLAEIVHQHHERIDGSGYPRGLLGTEILLEARILAVADTVEAMASHRPYRCAPGIDAALREIEKSKGVLYDDEVASACLRVIREKGFAFDDPAPVKA